MSNTPDTSLTRSVATESLADLLGNISETAIDSVIESGMLRDIPIIGTITGLMKAGRDVRSALFLRKIAVFLQELSQTSPEDRRNFVAQFDSEEKRHEFGQTVLMLLDRSEDIAKPRLIAKIVSAHIQGSIEYAKAMRLCAIIDRCYSQDLAMLKEFREGTQGDSTPIAESLLAVGLLSNGGFDGGTAGGNDGGVIYVLNEYGRLLIQYAL
ncbi:hypothetical protein AZOA_35200 [Azoarcus sp. Aa7]|nr:hypothetical protein [Azoarcus sp. Aa7]